MRRLALPITLLVIVIVFFITPFAISAMMQPRTIVVAAGGDFQAAMNAVQSGDTIVLQAGARFKAPANQAFVVPAKANVTVQSSLVAELPAGRVSPVYKSKMAAIVATGPQGALTGAQGATGWKFDGIEFTNESDGSQAQFCHTLIGFSGPQASTLHPSNFGSNITFTRSYIHPQEDGTTNYLRTAAHGIIWNAGAVAITNNWISGFAGVYAHNPTEIIDTVAIGNSAAGGPFYIDNNYISATFNPIFLGGGENGSPNVATVAAGATLTGATLSQVVNLQVGDKIALEVGATGGDQYACGTVQSIVGNTVTFTKLVRNEGGEQYVDSSRTPILGGKAKWRGFTIHDFTFTRNTVDTDVAASQWMLRTTGSKPKAYAEIKLLERGLFQGNIFQGFPTGIAITLRNQNGFSPWSNVKDVTFRDNLFKEFSSQIIQLFSGDRLSETGGNIQWINNLMDGAIPNALVGTFPSVAYTSFGQGVLFDHNTIINRQDVRGGLMMIGLAASGVTMRNNVMYFNTYGTQCAVAGNQFASCWPGFVEQGNIIVNNDNDCAYITGANGNFPRSFCAPGDFTLVDYRIPVDSPYKGKGTDSKDPGVDIDVLLAAIGGTLPQPTPSPTPTPQPSPSPSPSPTVSPTPVPTPLPTPTPVGNRIVDGYLKVNDDYFAQEATVTVSQPVQSYVIRPGGYFSFDVVVRGALLSATAEGYKFGPVVVGDEQYFILNGVVVQPSPTPTPTVTPTPTPIPTPTPTPLPTPSPTPQPCTISAPASVNIVRNSSGLIVVTLSNVSSTVNVQVIGSDGQVTVSPLSWSAGPTSMTKRFSVRVKRQSRTITFQGPCGSVVVKVNVV